MHTAYIEANWLNWNRDSARAIALAASRLSLLKTSDLDMVVIAHEQLPVYALSSDDIAELYVSALADQPLPSTSTAAERADWQLMHDGLYQLVKFAGVTIGQLMDAAELTRTT